MKLQCSIIPFIIKIVLISLVVVGLVYRETVLVTVSMLNLGATVDGYATLWCNINNNSALKCEVHMQAHMPSISHCDANLGSDIYNFCGA